MNLSLIPNTDREKIKSTGSQKKKKKINKRKKKKKPRTIIQKYALKILMPSNSSRSLRKLNANRYVEGCLPFYRVEE